MFTFPDTLYVRTQFSEIFVRPTIRSRKAWGKLKTRSKWPSTARSFKFKVTTLDETERETLRVFLENVSFGSDEFIFTHPQTRVEHTVVLMDDQVEMRYLRGGAWTVSFNVSTP